MNQNSAARQLSEHLDQLAAGQESRAEAGRFDPATEQAIRRLSALPALLPAPDAALEQRVWRRVQAAERTAGQRQPVPAWSTWPGQLRLGLMALVAILAVAATLFLPGPRAAVGNWMARFRLGRLDVVLAPEPTPRPTLAASSQEYASLAEAERAAGFHVFAPAYLPAGYELASVRSVSYEQLPVWMRPLYVESTYRSQAGAAEFAVLRQYNARQAGGVQVGEIEYQSEEIRATRALTLADGMPAVLLEFRQPDPPLRELIWERDGMTFELWSSTLSEDELLRLAESLL